MVLRETTAFGVRWRAMERRKLRRQARRVATPYGEVAVKLGTLDGVVLHATPEFESCKQLAAAAGLPLKRIYQAAEQALRESPGITGQP